MNDYERVAKVIRRLDEGYSEQPSLADLAAEVGLSEHHFHRLFARWAGVTPKAFLRCLTVEQAKTMLREGERVLQTSLAVGLSSPSRLHDACVQLAAASPGELRSGGEGWVIRYGCVPSPFGSALIAVSPRGVCKIAFGGMAGADEPLAELHAEWPNAELVENVNEAERWARRVFAPNAEATSQRPIKALVRGSAWQIKVWQALLAVPEGCLLSYGDLAKAIGHEGAARAVGSAVAANNLGYLVPCHRVIRSTGIVGQYRWGAERKRVLLAYEALASAQVEEG